MYLHAWYLSIVPVISSCSLKSHIYDSVSWYEGQTSFYGVVFLRHKIDSILLFWEYKIMSDFFFATWIYIFRYCRNLARYTHECISQMIWIVEICLFSWINLDYLKLIFVSHTWYCSASFPALLSKTALFIRAINFISLFFFCPVIALQFSSRSVQFSIRAPDFKSRVTLMPRDVGFPGFDQWDMINR